MRQLAGWKECQVAGASDKCANQCLRSDDDEEKGRVCCQCPGKEEKGTDTLECNRCWQQALGNRRFDGVAVDRAKRVICTFEFKRTLDREHGYVQRCDERATEQYQKNCDEHKMESASVQLHCWDEVHESRSVEQGDGNDWGSEAEVRWNAGKIHEGAVGGARNHSEQLSSAEVWRKRRVDRGGGSGLSRTLGKNWQEEGRGTTSTRSEVKRASS